MRRLAISVLLACTASAQTVVDPAAIPAAARALEYHEGEKNLRCEVEPTKPILNFGLRFQAGYLLEVPLVQYNGAGHSWTTTVRVAPEGGEPVYLTDRDTLPMASHPEFTAQTTGTFLLGEGRYRVDFAVADDQGRICRKQWQIAPALDRGARSIKIALPPNTVADLSYVAAANVAPAGPPMPRRITILIDSSPPARQVRRGFSTGDFVQLTGAPEFVDYREALLGLLASLVEKLPGTTVRAVVFDLDQQREVWRQDTFTLKDMGKAAHAIDDLEHWVVTVRELQQQPGRWGLLANLIGREVNEPDRSDVVLFLGSRNEASGQMPPHFLDAEKRSKQRFFYLQYSLFGKEISVGIPEEMSNTRLRANGRNQSPQVTGPLDTIEPADAIDLTVEKLNGKTLMVYSALDFAKAVEAIRRR